MRPSSDEARVEVRDDGIAPLPYTITYSVMLDYECPKCHAKTSVLDDSQAYVRRRELSR